MHKRLSSGRGSNLSATHSNGFGAQVGLRGPRGARPWAAGGAQGPLGSPGGWTRYWTKDWTRDWALVLGPGPKGAQGAHGAPFQRLPKGSMGPRGPRAPFQRPPKGPKGPGAHGVPVQRPPKGPRGPRGPQGARPEAAQGAQGLLGAPRVPWGAQGGLGPPQGALGPLLGGAREGSLYCLGDLNSIRALYSSPSLFFSIRRAWA